MGSDDGASVGSVDGLVDDGFMLGSSVGRDVGGIDGCQLVGTNDGN